MRPVATWLALGLAAAGCSPNYRMLVRREVAALDTKQGRAPVVGGVKYRAFRETIETSPHAKSVTRITDLRGRLEPGHFAVSPDGRWLVYQALVADANPPRWNLFRICTTGTGGATQLTTGSYMDLEPAFAPDGSAIYFASDRTSHLHKICRIRADGAPGISRVTHGDSEDRLPSVAPDNSAIYYTSRPFNASDHQLWRVEPTGNLPTQLREGWQPRVSPDGKKLLYCARDPKTQLFRVWTMNLDGTNQTQLLATPEGRERDPAWSPDGSKIVFASNAGKDSAGHHNLDIWIASADGSGLTQLTTNGSSDLMPQFSPDGKFIYFLSNRGFYWDIWRMEVADPARRAPSP